MSKLTEVQTESSDDEVPEEVSFDSSKSAALKSVKDALEAAKREKSILKEKRKKRQQLFQEQKKKKILPQELLEEFNKETQPGPSDNKGIRVLPKPTHNNKDKKTGNAPKNISKSLPESYTVTRIKDESAEKSLQQKAMDFIQYRLYGPGARRTTNAALLSLKKKTGANQGPGVDFGNQNLSVSRKARSNKKLHAKRKSKV